MAIMTVVKFPDPRLRQVSRHVDEPVAHRDLLMDMAMTMYAANGAGLAAIQVGEPRRLFIIDAHFAGREQKEPPLVFINPEILSTSKEKEIIDEGCLSLPQVVLNIARYRMVSVRATNAAGEVFEHEATGMLARALQHELDHLNGRLIIDHVGRIRRRLIERKLKRALMVG